MEEWERKRLNKARKDMQSRRKCEKEGQEGIRYRAWEGGRKGGAGSEVSRCTVRKMPADTNL